MSSLSIRLTIRNYFYYKLEIKFHFFFFSPFIALPNMDLIFFPHNNTNSTAYLIAKKEKGKKEKKKKIVWYMK